MMSRSWLLRVTILCVVLFLLLSVDSVEAKKKKKKSGDKAAAKVADTNVDATSDNVKAAAAAAAAAPVQTPETAAAREAAAKALKRKRELLRKRKEKRAKAYAASQEAAKRRANKLAMTRSQKTVRDQKAKAAAKQRADALVAKKRKADTPDIRKRGHDKLKWLMKRTAESGTRMIQFDTSNYHQFISDGPRPYHLMIVYTALSPQYSCHYCHIVDAALKPVAQAHYERTKEKTAYVLAANSTADIPDQDLPVFFCNVDMGRNKELFNELKFTQAPYMILAPPRLGTKTLKPMDFLRQLPQKYRFNLQASMNPSDFSGFINKLAGIHVNLDDAKPGFTDLLFALFMLSGIAFVGFKYGYDILMKLREIGGIRSIVLIGGCCMYCWCISGGMYNILRGTAWADVGKDGHTNSYINGDARDQYAAEGLIIGVLNLACAAVLIFVNLRSFDDGAPAAPAKGAKLTPFQHLKNAISPFFSPAVCLALFVALWFQVVDIYTRKNWGYRRGFVWRS